jgi:hypothetical protein
MVYSLFLVDHQFSKPPMRRWEESDAPDFCLAQVYMCYRCHNLPISQAIFRTTTGIGQDCFQHPSNSTVAAHFMLICELIMGVGVGRGLLFVTGSLLLVT